MLMLMKNIIMMLYNNQDATATPAAPDNQDPTAATPDIQDATAASAAAANDVVSVSGVLLS